MSVKSVPAPPLVTTMIATSHLSTDRKVSGTVKIEGDLTDTLLLTEAKANTSPPRRRRPSSHFLVIPPRRTIQLSALGDRTNRQPRIRFHFVRHAQAQHNLRHLTSNEAGGIPNPPLTCHGQLQCEQLEATFPHTDRITHILCSPLHRTLETAILAFPSLPARGHEILAWAPLREYGMAPCNRGDPLPELQDKVRGFPVNLDLLKPGWEDCEIMRTEHMRVHALTIKRELYAFAYTQLRGGIWNGMVFQPFSGDADLEILVVSHGSMLKMLTGKGFSNAQFKTFRFAGPLAMRAGMKKWDFIETTQSRERIHVRLEDVRSYSTTIPMKVVEPVAEVEEVEDKNARQGDNRNPAGEIS